MFGYVKPKKSELLIKDYEFYRAAYCGICREMKKTVGALSPAFLTYDSVFLALCRMVFLPDADFSAKRCRCVAHPVRGRTCLSENPALAYTARAFACLSYHKLLDDLADEAAIRRAGLTLTRPILAHAKASAGLADLDALMTEKLTKIRELEESNSPSVDLGAELFGDLLAATFAYGMEGNAKTLLSVVGFHLGKFIYSADAAEDYDRDRKEKKYNPYVARYGGAPLTAENRATIRIALDLECRAIAEAVDLYPFGTRKTLERLIRNVVFLGLPERLSFLDEDKSKQEVEPV